MSDNKVFNTVAFNHKITIYKRIPLYKYSLAIKKAKINFETLFLVLLIKHLFS